MKKTKTGLWQWHRAKNNLRSKELPWWSCEDARKTIAIQMYYHAKGFPYRPADQIMRLALRSMRIYRLPMSGETLVSLIKKIKDRSTIGISSFTAVLSWVSSEFPSNEYPVNSKREIVIAPDCLSFKTVCSKEQIATGLERLWQFYTKHATDEAVDDERPFCMLRGQARSKRECAVCGASFSQHVESLREYLCRSKECRDLYYYSQQARKLHQTIGKLSIARLLKARVTSSHFDPQENFSNQQSKYLLGAICYEYHRQFSKKFNRTSGRAFRRMGSLAQRRKQRGTGAQHRNAGEFHSVIGSNGH